MSKTALNKKNLIPLGAETLSDLLLEVIKGNAALQRRVRMELSAQQGPADVARDLRKRFASIRRASSRVSARKQPALAKELNDLVALIETRIAPEAPDEGFDMIWAFLHLAPGLHERTDDSHGRISDVMERAVAALTPIAPRLSATPITLAETLFEALQDSDYGAFDGVIPALAEGLGAKGLEHLKTMAIAAERAPLTREELGQYDYARDADRQITLAREARARRQSAILQDIADLQNDVDAYMARYRPEQLTYHTIAPDVAARLLDAGRANEALALIKKARDKLAGSSLQLGREELDEAYLTCLDALDQTAEAQAFLWDSFCQTLNPDHLRRHLKALPDFDDIDAEDAAREIALAFPQIEAALGFFLNWPDLASAAKLIIARADELNGEHYQTLPPAAEVLDAEHPLAANLIRRAMIHWTLSRGRAKRYGYAARHLADCAAADPRIEDHAGHPDHIQYVQDLQEKFPRNQGFWALVAFGE